MNAHFKHQWSDHEILTALHLRDHELLTMAEIGERLDRPRNSVCGILHRVDKQSAKHDPHGIQNGTLKPLWWRRP